MKKLIIGLTLLASLSALASFEGLYNGQTREGKKCTLEILSYAQSGSSIIVEYKTSMQKDRRYIYTGYGEVDDYAAGKISGDYEKDNTEELVQLYFKVNQYSSTLTGLKTMSITRWEDGDRELDDVCTYLERQ